MLILALDVVPCNFSHVANVHKASVMSLSLFHQCEWEFHPLIFNTFPLELSLNSSFRQLDNFHHKSNSANGIIHVLKTDHALRFFVGGFQRHSVSDSSTVYSQQTAIAAV